MKKTYILVLCMLFFSACVPQRNLVYFNDLSELAKDQISSAEAELKIHKNARLSISVNSLSPESNALFTKTTTRTNTKESHSVQSNQIDHQSMVTLPLSGNITGWNQKY
ncbi:hypothetical protein AQ505_17605 [Pedobacter sp. PACM 27299]|uniref:hypothetical protein n=1 Tax=Pedobacter sp. PACM 27299 TaxID=1727164 RepID=UPI000705F85C|nr:hypothetical protein [Pedobacter sp. PACM 27299]ALL07142.1 hypothetical protein AQ505_17605 [Pedobacter sp. PACM 27299]